MHCAKSERTTEPQIQHGKTRAFTVVMRNNDGASAGIGVEQAKGRNDRARLLGTASEGRPINGKSVPIVIVPSRDIEGCTRAHYEKGVKASATWTQERSSEHDRVPNVSSSASVLGLQVVLTCVKRVNYVGIAEGAAVFITSKHRETIMERPANARDKLVFVDHPLDAYW